MQPDQTQLRRSRSQNHERSLSRRNIRQTRIHENNQIVRSHAAVRLHFENNHQILIMITEIAQIRIPFRRQPIVRFMRLRDKLLSVDRKSVV